MTFSFFNRALSWAQMLDDDEPIWAPSFQMEYLGFPPRITTKELEILVDFLNNYWILLDSPRRVCWTAGELIPYPIGLIGVQKSDR